jgi:hypothetical protein
MTSQPQVSRPPPEPESLAARLARTGRLDIATIADLGGQLARALDALHGAGSAHGGLTPDHVLLVPDPTRRRGERVEVQHVAVASPASIAEARDDDYALGCIAFEMATGRVPDPAGAIPLARAFEPDLPAPLEALIASLMARDPDARPTLQQATAAFAYLPDALPVAAAPIALPDWRTAAPSPEPWATPRRMAAVVLVALALALAVLASIRAFR